MELKPVNNPEQNPPLRFQKFLLPNQFKKIGLFVFVISFVSLFINAFAIENMQIRFLAKNGILIGMLLIAISKENFEDELISNLRMQSFALAFIVGVLYSLFQPYLNYSVDLIFSPEDAIFKDTGDFQILWILLSVKVIYFESLKRFHK